MAPGKGAIRLTRVAFFAVSAVGLAAAAHRAGGDDLSPLAAVLAVPAVMIVVNLLAGRRRGPVSLLAGMALTQVVLHLAFMVLSLGSDCGPAVPMAGMEMTAGHPHPAALCLPAGGHADISLWPTGSMALWHTIATGLTVLLLARGEAMIWALIAGLGFRVPPAGLHRPLTVVPRLTVSTEARRRPARTVHLRTVQRRGPPVLARAVS